MTQVYRAYGLLILVALLSIAPILGIIIVIQSGNWIIFGIGCLLLLPCLFWCVRLKVSITGDLLEYRSLFKTYVVQLSQVTDVDVYWRKPRKTLSPPGYRLEVGGEVIPLNTAPFGGRCHRAIFDQLPSDVRDAAEAKIRADAH